MPIDNKKVKKAEEENKSNDEPEVITIKTSDSPKKAEDVSSIATDEEKPKEEKAETPKVTSFGLIDTTNKFEEKEDKSTSSTTETTEKNPQKSGEISKEEVNKWIENYDESPKPEKPGGKKVFKIILFALLGLSLVAIIAGGIIYYQKATSKNEKREVQTQPTPSQESVTTPSPATESATPSEIKFSNYTVQIQNGSGIPGEAGKVKELLVSAKFKKIDTGNASSYDYKDTEVELKDGVPSAVYDKIENLLKNTYTVVKSSEAVKDASAYDAIIVVGVRK